jgi:predicted NBD/HSP70 family sugar kinase
MIIAIDIGGTKIAAALVSGASFKELVSQVDRKG